ncbi:MAG TPA: hypothetical protein VET23_01285 [Chitinophagaceae bacterium]|nr:hypothetical protein [Chitinophagaceae bacterium]
MKRMLILSIAFAMQCSFANAKIWRVNNNPGVVADFTTAQAAHDAASAGDTIHLEPSANSYGSVIATKRLVWIGIGDFLTQNPGQQFSVDPPSINSLWFNSGSDGSLAMGIEIISGGTFIYAPSVSVIRCKLGGGVGLYAGSDGCLISQCFSTSNISIAGSITNAIISNNILSFFEMGYNTSATAVVTNNVFTQGGNDYHLYNTVFQNNILTNNLGFASLVNCNVSYNMSSGSNLPSGNNNVQNVDMATVFQNIVNMYLAVDKDYQLKAGSPAIGAGFGGVDMGAFGGSNPYVLALQPPVPAITNLSTPSSSGGNTIQVTFSAKSNN